MKLNPRQTKSGVTASKRQFPSAFIAHMKSGHQGVFKRVGRKRLPIKEITVPINPPAENSIKQALNKTAAYFKKELERDLAWRLRR